MSLGKPILPAEKESSLPASKAYYTTGEVARLFGVTPKTVVNWCDSKRLPCITTPAGHRRIPVSAFAGGREFDARVAEYEAMVTAMLGGAPPPSGDEIAAQVRTRRKG